VTLTADPFDPTPVMPVPPSFSSFPPSFASFPDFGGNSTQDKEKAASSTVPVQKRGPKEKDKKSARKKRERDRRDRHSSPSPSRERGGGSRDLQNDGQFFDDERKKAEEDSARRTRQQDVSQPVFFSDKKGDPLSVQYGGIASKDIPRYHLVGRKSSGSRGRGQPCTVVADR